MIEGKISPEKEDRQSTEAWQREHLNDAAILNKPAVKEYKLCQKHEFRFPEGGICGPCFDESLNKTDEGRKDHRWETVIFPDPWFPGMTQNAKILSREQWEKVLSERKELEELRQYKAEQGEFWRENKELLLETATFLSVTRHFIDEKKDFPLNPKGFEGRADKLRKAIVDIPDDEEEPAKECGDEPLQNPHQLVEQALGNLADKSDGREFKELNSLLGKAPCKWANLEIEQMPQDDGWIKWEGGECPALGKAVKYKTRSGDLLYSGAARWLSWRHEGVGHDIIAYRVVEEEPKALLERWVTISASKNNELSVTGFCRGFPSSLESICGRTGEKTWTRKIRYTEGGKIEDVTEE
jgi:hypothetical protein